MRGSLDLNLVFPVRDATSAELMRLKGDCLYAAGIIDARVRRLVHIRCAALSVDGAIGTDSGQYFESMNSVVPYGCCVGGAEVRPNTKL